MTGVLPSILSVLLVLAGLLVVTVVDWKTGNTAKRVLVVLALTAIVFLLVALPFLGVYTNRCKTYCVESGHPYSATMARSHWDPTVEPVCLCQLRGRS